MPIDTRAPGIRLLLVLLVGGLLAVPLFATYLLVYDRQSQSEAARTAIAAGWGGPQVLAGPVLVLPYEEQVTETATENGRQVQRVGTVQRELTLAPDVADIRTGIAPKRRHKSIYEAVLYEAEAAGTARFSLPADLARSGLTPERLHFDRAELRFGLADARGLFGPRPAVSANGRALRLQPGHGPAETNGSGFFAVLDAGAIRGGPLAVTFRLAFRGNASLALAPSAGDTRWRVHAAWPDPSFGGDFLPVGHVERGGGFAATWRVGNLALGRSLASAAAGEGDAHPAEATRGAVASVDLISPIDLYSEVNRSVKYGFLFIGFTFVAFFMFDVVGGVRVAVAEYLLVGAGLILFFSLLLAFAEVIGFTPAYLVAAGAIVELLSAYSAAVLRSWRRAGGIAGLLTGLYAVLYVLLSLVAYSLLIGSLLLFAALAGIMYLTRNIDWGGRRAPSSPEVA